MFSSLLAPLHPRRWHLHLLPPRCLLCGLASDVDRDLCRICALDLPRIEHCCPRCGMPVPAGATAFACGRCQRRPPTLTSLTSRCAFAEPADALVHQLKFDRRMAAARVMAELMCQAPPAIVAQSTPRLLPVPLHWRRRWHRGFDQAALLAQHLARISSIPMAPQLVRRNRATSAQTGLDAAARRRNLRGAFTVDALAGGGMPSILILVDDVATTGATLNSVARACLRAGARQVHAWVFARATGNGRG